MKTTIAVIIAAIMMVVGTASAITVTYTGNAAVNINGAEYGGNNVITMNTVPPVAVTEPVITEEPVVEVPVVEEPTYNNVVTYAGPGGRDANGYYTPVQDATGHVVYIVMYADGPVVGYEKADNGVSIAGQNMPPFGTYYEQAAEMYATYIA
jgi:hypothetical protein